MPRNGSGVYSKPAGTTAVPNTTIESAKYNATIDDLVQDANAARPTTAGGTGSGTVAGARANLGVDQAKVFVTKSGAYTAVAGDNNAFYEFTAPATLSLTAAATLGADWHMTVFANGGAVTIDPDASETINGASTLVLQNGDAVHIICTGTAFKAVVIPTASSAKLGEANTFTKMQKWAKGADIASAAALTLGTDGNYFDVTGGTAITSISTVGVGTVVKLHFDSALILTHHATDLVLPGSAHILTGAGDEAEFVEYAPGDWRCTHYQYAAYMASGGVIGGGSNANGSYVRFADGTQICTVIRSINIGNLAAAGNIYRDILAWGGGWTFPAAFAGSPPSVAFSLESSVHWLSGGPATTTGTGLITVLGYANFTLTANAHGIAIGRFF